METVLTSPEELNVSVGALNLVQGPQGEKGEKGEKGDDGAPGLDATINGLNAITLAAGEMITLSEAGSVFTISADGIPSAEKGAACGVATLDADGKVPLSQLPESISDVGGDVTVAKIEYGSYVGTNVYGSSNPNVLTFGFPPKIVAIFNQRHSTYYPHLLAVRGATQIYTSSAAASNGDYYVNATWEGNTFSFYSGSAEGQYNYSGRGRYYYVGIG